ncbi:TapB family protein [Limnoglobus roseus]|uniref:DUF3108 domain-containing protein n=1 Tax=Limnoglobus roseus TaxID=2598579 RepID=A0A5C1AL42_9BACT|nr:hypothetical protein [Limnoglobus roseus]QEL18676.1 hypothetical protein PX52LOC_05710 [Limnoglobus roseus]
MFRTLVVLPAVVSMAVAAPPPKGADKDAGLYFPTKVGVKRVYIVTTDAGKVESTETVTKVEGKDGDWRVTTEWDLADVDRADTVTVTAVSAKGVSVVARRGKELADAEPTLRLPAMPGDEWEFSPTPEAGAAQRTYTYTVGKAEDVETPAGTFNAVPVEGKRKNARGPFSDKYWYAPGVGLVKSVVKVGDFEQTMTLKSLTRGK